MESKNSICFSYFHGLRFAAAWPLLLFRLFTAWRWLSFSFLHSALSSFSEQGHPFVQLTGLLWVVWTRKVSPYGNRFKWDHHHHNISHGRLLQSLFHEPLCWRSINNLGIAWLSDVLQWEHTVTGTASVAKEAYQEHRKWWLTEAVVKLWYTQQTSSEFVFAFMHKKYLGNVSNGAYALIVRPWCAFTMDKSSRSAFQQSSNLYIYSEVDPWTCFWWYIAY